MAATAAAAKAAAPGDAAAAALVGTAPPTLMQALATRPVSARARGEGGESESKSGSGGGGARRRTWRRRRRRRRPTATCIIMAAEILRSMLYRGSELKREVAWIIYDEIHYMRDKERGITREESTILLPHKARFVFLSATIPNARELMTGGGGDGGGGDCNGGCGGAGLRDACVG